MAPLYGPDPPGVEAVSYIAVGIVAGGVVLEEGEELREQVDYLYYAAKNLKKQLDSVKSSIEPRPR